MAKEYLSSDADSSQIDPSAQIGGQTLIAGTNTRIGPGAVIHDSYIENAVIEQGARITDSVVIADMEPLVRERKNDFTDRWCIDGGPTVVREGALVDQCSIRNTTIGAGSTCIRCALSECTVGEYNYYREVFAEWAFSAHAVTVEGPAEFSNPWIGHHARIDRCACFGGILSNDFYVLETDSARGLVVKETIDLPHASRYGLNVIDSLNSGRIRPLEHGLKTLGRHDTPRGSLSCYQSTMHGPCCWIAGWTKVVGKSGAHSPAPDALVKDTLRTYVMPFALAGMRGSSVMAQAMPGEQMNAYHYKERVPGWVFTYAPGAVFAMVKRVFETMNDREPADRIAALALKSALALTHFYAAERTIDLRDTTRSSSKGWRGWLSHSKSVLEKHLASGLWEFKNGEPVNWQCEHGTWIPKDPEALLSIASDALKNQHTEDDLLRCEQAPLERRFGATAEELAPTRQEASVSPDATVSSTACIGPGVQIRGASVVGDGAWLYRTVVRNGTVGRNARLWRSHVYESTIGADSRAVNAAVVGSAVESRCTLRDCRVEMSSVAAQTAIAPYARVRNCRIGAGSDIGTGLSNCDIATIIVAKHMPGEVAYVRAGALDIPLGDTNVSLYAPPMFGGGVRVLGDNDRPIYVECAFLGSNLEIEPGAYIGFGCFAQERLTSVEGLPPFTVSPGPGPSGDQIGAAASQFAHIVLSHFLEWTYKLNGPDKAPAVAKMITCQLTRGKDAVTWALGQRADGSWDNNSPFAQFKSLELYTDRQLQEGLKAYETQLADDRFGMEYADGELRFTGHGVWRITDGMARWVAQDNH
ncbi:MAG: hypothetical protein GF418_14075 [Chitinivibrionales bacterium]|nr:hypothetical protein [Chitinivibrionales bacterium]MBD3396746.1 hypothetical protein [Chitinivibrionales bacterium]